MQFTAIHRGLGLEPQPLTWTLIEQAVDAGLPEQADLDWKGKRHEHKGLVWKDELAKDVAAMANSGGGIIVVGVSEDKPTSKAVGFDEPVQWNDLDVRKYREVIYNNTHPPVSDVTFDNLINDEGSVLVITIAPSLDAPHLLIRNDIDFRAPFRDGTLTLWMKERQLAAAYRSRFTDRGDFTARLHGLYDEVAGSSHADSRVTFVAVAAPETPRPPSLGRITGSKATYIFQNAHLLQNALFPFHDRSSPLLDKGASLERARRGFHRQTARYDREDGAHSRYRSAQASVHDNGAVSLAWTLGGIVSDTEPHEVTSVLVEVAVGSFLAVLASAARSLGMTGSYELRVGLAWEGSDPITIHGPGELDAPEPYAPTAADDFYPAPVHTIPIKAFVPVDISIDAMADDDTLREAASELALDCVAQGGVDTLEALRTELR